MIDLAVERRGAASTVQFDPVIVRLLAEHEPFQQFIKCLYSVLIGDAGADARVSARHRHTYVTGRGRLLPRR